MANAPAKAAAIGTGAVGTGIVGLAVLLATTNLTAPSEGLATKPYWDPAHIRSYCFGETTHVEERTYSKPECEALLEQRMARDYAPPLERCAPQAATQDRVKIFAALLDASYNAGTGAVCSSPMVARVKAGDVAGAIAAFTAKHQVGPIVANGWYVTATYRGKPQPSAAMLHAGWIWTGKAWVKQFPGLVCRRIKEARMAAGLPIGGCK